MLDTVRATPVFAGSTTSELETIAGLCERVTVKRGERLFESNTPADSVYIVVEGAIELSFNAIHYNEAYPMSVERLFKGDLVGWSALTELRGNYTLAASAVQDSELLRMSGDKLRGLCADNHHFGYVLQRNVAGIIARRFALVLAMLITTVQDGLTRREPGA